MVTVRCRTNWHAAPVEAPGPRVIAARHITPALGMALRPAVAAETLAKPYLYVLIVGASP